MGRARNDRALSCKSCVGTPPLMAPGPIKLAGIRLSPCLVTVNRQFANPPNLPSLLETLLNSLGMDRGRPIQTFARLVSLLNNSVRAHVSAKLSNQAIGNIFITKIIKRRKPNNFLILWKEDLESRILNKSRVHSFLSNHCL